MCSYSRRVRRSTGSGAAAARAGGRPPAQHTVSDTWRTCSLPHGAAARAVRRGTRHTTYEAPAWHARCSNPMGRPKAGGCPCCCGACPAALTGHRIPHDMERERERERGCAHVAALAEFESRVGGPFGPQRVRACVLVMVVLHGLDRRRIRRRQPDLRSCAVMLVQCSHRSNAKAMHCRTRHALPHLSCCTKPRASTPTSHRRRTLVLNGANRRPPPCPVGLRRCR